jgi:hypothetical protein
MMALNSKPSFYEDDLYNIEEKNAFILWLVSSTHNAMCISRNSVIKKHLVTKEIKGYITLVNYRIKW